MRAAVDRLFRVTPIDSAWARSSQFVTKEGKFFHTPDLQ
jgi:hypothetical protein